MVESGASAQACSGRCGCSDAALNSFCAALSTDSRAVFCQAARSLYFEKGAVLSATDIALDIFVVKSGVMATVFPTKRGKSQNIFMAKAGYLGNIMRVAGDTAAYGMDYNDGHFGCALTEVRGCAIPLDVVRRLFRQDSAFAQLLFAHLSDRYKDALSSMTCMTELSGGERIAWLLEELASAGVDTAGVTHEMIGQLLGMNRVSVTRLMGSVLKQLQQQG